MKSIERTEYFEILGENFSKIQYPELYSLYKISPENLKLQLSSLAQTCHEGSVGSASRCLESDLEHIKGTNIKLVWLPDELNSFFGQEVYTFPVQSTYSIRVQSKKLYESESKLWIEFQKKHNTLSKRGTTFFEAFNTETSVDQEGILEIPDRYKEIFSYNIIPSFEIINEDYFIIHFKHEN